MSKTIKGEITVTAPDGPMVGDFTLLLDFNALCDLEDDFPGLMEGKLDIKGVKPIRRIFHAGFQEHHPGMTEREAGAIIHSLGLAQATAKLAEAMTASFPEAKSPANPQQRPAKAGPGNER